MLRDGAFRFRRAAFRIEIGNDGWSWPAGDQTVQAAAQAKSGRRGTDGLTELRNRFARQVRLASLTEPLPDSENRVQLAEELDSLGIPRPRISYRTGDYAMAGIRAARELHKRLFDALGATEIHHWDGPQGAGHVMGTCRMGADPASSVVDAQLRVHGKPNCFVAARPSIRRSAPPIRSCSSA